MKGNTAMRENHSRLTRILSAVLSVLMFCATFAGLIEFTDISAEAYDPTTMTPTVKSTTSSYYFRATPSVFEMGDGYAVIWATSFKGTGYIKYTYQGVSYTVYDQAQNITKTHDDIHVVKVPHEHLDGNSYTVYSQVVTANNATSATMGTTISCGPISLKARNTSGTVNALQFTDTHSYTSCAVAVAQQYTTNPDILIFTGDIADNLQTRDYIINNLFGLIASVSCGRYPVVYCRGNHEARGRYSTMLLQYFPTETGEYYFDFEYGDLYGVVLDTGEDKLDSHSEYGGMTNYKEYVLKQEAWLNSLPLNTTAKYKLLIHHIPRLQSLGGGTVDITDSVNALGMNFGISGHDHSTSEYAVGKNNLNFRALNVGGTKGSDCTGAMLQFKNGNMLTYVCKSQKGTTKVMQTITLSTTYGTPPTPVSYVGGLNAQSTTAATSSPTMSFTSAPSVFESGGDYYNVVWTTSDTASGYVEYTYKGTKYQLWDEVGGYRRTYDTIHTVKVPKEHLNNNKYRVISFHMTKHEAYSYTRGDCIYSPYYLFEDHSGNENVTMLALPDIKADTYSDALTKLQSAVAALGTNPAIIVAHGDVVNNLVTTTNLETFFKATAAASGSSHPIVFARGNGECRGGNATKLMSYIPTVNDKFYFAYDYGKYTIAVLDTAEDKADDHAEYSGLVDFDALRVEQTEWLKNLNVPKGNELIVISHFSYLNNYFGLDWASILDQKGALLVLTGHNRQFNTPITSGVLDVMCGGYASNNTFIATEILVGGGSVRIKAANDSGTVTTDKTIEITGNTAVTETVSAIVPSKVNGVYRITCPENLIWLSENTTAANAFAGETFELMNDIDMRFIPFTPIGGHDTATAADPSCASFAGTFNGNGYTVYNLNIESTLNYIGLFGVLNGATVNNLSVKGSITGVCYVGGIAGLATASKFSNCYNYASIHSSATTTLSRAGGIAGLIRGGTVIDACANLGSVSSTATSGPMLGGIAGRVNGTDENVISNTYNRGAIIACVDGKHSATACDIGGIFGYLDGANLTVSNCYNTGATVSTTAGGNAIGGEYTSSATLTLNNTYYLSTNAFKQLAFNGASTNAATSGSAVAKTASAMKSESFANTLNADVYVYIADFNGGYPSHVGEAPEYSIALKPTSGLTISGGMLYGISADVTVDDLMAQLRSTANIEISGIGTGETISLVIDGKVYDKVVIFIRGDVNGDGAADTSDKLVVSAVVMSKDSLDGLFKTAGDINADGYFTSADVIALAAHISGDIPFQTHSYSSACDESCDICGATRDVAHTYDNACDADCNACGASRTITHTYTNSCDTSCNVCGASRSITHTYANACDTDCNVCGATRTVGAHVYDNEADASCNACGHERTKLSDMVVGIYVKRIGDGYDTAIINAFKEYLVGADIAVNITYRYYGTADTLVAEFGSLVNADGDVDVLIGAGNNIDSTGGVTILAKAHHLTEYNADGSRYCALLTEADSAIVFYNFVTGTTYAPEATAQ